MIEDGGRRQEIATRGQVMLCRDTLSTGPVRSEARIAEGDRDDRDSIWRSSG
jgi:hypothetical protein